MKIILDSSGIKQKIDQLSAQIINDLPQGTPLAVIGIRNRGEFLGNRLVKQLIEELNCSVEQGALDIAMYRDDINHPHGDTIPNVRPTDIPFDVEGKLIILADDVLNTGRSCRAALDALIDLGRPIAIKLAVLVDRGGRELPIQPDYVGCTVEVDDDEALLVSFVESDGEDKVSVEKAL